MLFLPLVPVSVVVLLFAVSVAVTVIVPSGKPERSTLVANLPVGPMTPVPETVNVPSVNLNVRVAPGVPLMASGAEVAPGVFVPDGRLTPAPFGSDRFAAAVQAMLSPQSQAPPAATALPFAAFPPALPLPPP